MIDDDVEYIDGIPKVIHDHVPEQQNPCYFCKKRKMPNFSITLAKLGNTQITI